MMSTERIQSRKLPEERLDKRDTRSNHLGVLSEHLTQRCDINENPPKSKLSPALHSGDLEPKKPRRKDTPALHTSPFVAGVRLLQEERHKVIMEDEEKDGEKLPF
ncbi:protein phosphatase 1 regulatory subunit 17 [Sarcophilus harrisii]